MLVEFDTFCGHLKTNGNQSSHQVKMLSPLTEYNDSPPGYKPNPPVSGTGDQMSRIQGCLKNVFLHLFWAILIVFDTFCGQIGKSFFFTPSVVGVEKIRHHLADPRKQENGLCV